MIAQGKDLPNMNGRINRTLDLLGNSAFRSRFKLDKKDLYYIRKKGVDAIRRHAFDFVTSRISDQFPKNDGKQTPMRGHPAFKAQHATATCCRGCLEKWHRIRKGKALTEKEVEFVVNVIMTWIERQMQVL